MRILKILKPIARPFYMNLGGPAMRRFVLGTIAAIRRFVLGTIAAIRRFVLRVHGVLGRYTVYQILEKCKSRVLRKFLYLNYFGKRFVDRAVPAAIVDIDSGPVKSKIDTSRIKASPELEFDSDFYDMVMCIPFTGRYDILEVVVAEFFAAQDDQHKLAVSLVGTTVADLEFAARMRDRFKHIAYQQCPDFPLGRKAQLVLDLAGTVKTSAVIMNGSDDILTPRYVKSCIDYIRLGSIDFIAPIVWYTYNAAPGSSTYGLIWRTHYVGAAAGSSLGAGRAYSTKFLKKIDYEVFSTSKDIHLDTKMEEMAATGTIRTVHPSREDGAIVSIKGAWDKLNDIESLLENCPTVQFTDVEFEAANDVETVREIRLMFSGLPPIVERVAQENTSLAT